MNEVSYHKRQPENANIIDDLKDIAKTIDEKEVGGVIEISGFKLSDMEDELKALGWENQGLDANGFQWDFWLYLTKDDRRVVISGCGYWGTSYKIREDKE